MNILILDDQLSVLNGITNGVDFNRLGIKQVFTASNVSDAKTIIQTNTIDILLSDIEMPGENGLTLNKWVYENHPDILRILLTSHAPFTYAKESIKLGFFDYIVQPAPYTEIEASLSRAIARLTADRQKSKLFDLEDTFHIVEKIYSSNPANQEQAIRNLNEMGYAIHRDSWIQTMLIDINPYAVSGYVRTDTFINSLLLHIAGKYFTGSGTFSLACINRYKQFVLFLLNNNTAMEAFSHTVYEAFYEELCGELTFRIACYVSDIGRFEQIQSVHKLCDALLLNNVSQKPGLYFVQSDTSVPQELSLTERTVTWTRFLENYRFESLRDSIFTFINYNASTGKFDLGSLSDFHQEITKMFFVYSYRQNIDIMGLFSESYSYKDYMNCFRNVDALKEGLSFIIDAIAQNSDTENNKGNVQKAIDYILSNLSNDISVKEVAAYVHFNPEYFSKLFKKETGENVKNYILRLKVNAAKELLANPNISINAVAAELGYSNFSHFTQIFKKHENMTPTEYRKKVLQPNKQELF